MSGEKKLKYQTSAKSVQWEPSCSMRTDEETWSEPSLRAILLTRLKVTLRETPSPVDPKKLNMRRTVTDRRQENTGWKEVGVIGSYWASRRSLQTTIMTYDLARLYESHATSQGSTRAAVRIFLAEQWIRSACSVRPVLISEPANCYKRNLMIMMGRFIAIASLQQRTTATTLENHVHNACELRDWPFTILPRYDSDYVPVIGPWPNCRKETKDYSWTKTVQTSAIQPGVREDELGVRKIKKKKNIYIYIYNKPEPHQLIADKLYNHTILLG
jgi:hypothetical protein